MELVEERDERAKKEYHTVKENNLLGTGVKKVSEDQEIIFKNSVWYNKLK